MRPALSESSESHLRSSSHATRPGRIQRGRPTSPQAVASKLHSSGKSNDAGRRQPRGSLPHHDRRGAGALHQICAASPRRPVLRVTVVGRRARDGAVCRAAAVTAMLGRLAECARLSPAWAMLVAPVVSTLGGSLAASRASRNCVGVSAWLTGRPSQPAGPSGHGRRARDGAVCRAAAVTAMLGIWKNDTLPNPDLYWDI